MINKLFIFFALANDKKHNAISQKIFIILFTMSPIDDCLKFMTY